MTFGGDDRWPSPGFACRPVFDHLAHLSTKSRDKMIGCCDEVPAHHNAEVKQPGLLMAYLPLTRPC
jgi:hypothetical protein